MYINIGMYCINVQWNASITILTTSYDCDFFCVFFFLIAKAAMPSRRLT